MNMRIAAVCLLALPLVASAAPRSLEDFKTIYEQEAAKLKAANPALDQANAAYVRALDTLIAKFTRTADFEGTVAVRKEKERFEAARSVPEKPEAKLPADLLQVQAQYRSMFRRAERAQAQRVAVLSQQYARRLRDMMRDRLAEKQMTEAAKVNDEIKRIEFILADLAATLKPADTAPDRNETPDTAPAATHKALSLALKRDLVLHYDFNSDSSKTVTDRSKKRNHGRPTGGAWVPNARGIKNGAYEFNGRAWIDSMVTRESAAKLGAFTAAAWVKPMDEVAEQHIFARTDGKIWYQNAGGFGLDFSREAGRRFLGFHFNEGGDRRNPVGTALTIGKWHHVAVSLNDEGEIAVCVDGARVLKKDGFGSIPALPGGFFRLGRWSTEDIMGYFYHGLIDDFMVWERALSEKQVSELHTSTR